jgi:hypothetical protein
LKFNPKYTARRIEFHAFLGFPEIRLETSFFDGVPLGIGYMQ